MSITKYLLAQRSFLSKGNIKIIDYILDNPKKTTLLTSQELAHETQVAQSSVIKLSQKLGYKGFSSFKMALLQALNQENKLLNPSVPIHSKISVDDNVVIIAQKLIQEKQEAIIATTNAIDFVEFELLISLIFKANKIQVIGIAGSSLTAKDLSFKLLKIGITTLCEQDTHIQIATANTLQKGDVQIAISQGGKNKEILIATQAALTNNATVIAITTPSPSPLRKMAHYCLNSISGESKYRSSSISSRSAQHVLVDLIFMALLQKKGDNAKLLMADINIAIQKI
ncbi:MAG TPA: SIS domain-containing protein [Psychromonas hadalis]|nr:SIS domain-containing protein [Psychromonas hadalis]